MSRWTPEYGMNAKVSFMGSSWTQADAVQLARRLEALASTCGYHVALTGGCLYKDGPRKDVDIVLYPHWFSPQYSGAAGFDNLNIAVERGDFLDGLPALGIRVTADMGRVVKCEVDGLRCLDLMFPAQPFDGPAAKYKIDPDDYTGA